MHCHMENHQLEGMSAILKIGRDSDIQRPPTDFPQCGNFKMTNDEFEDLINSPRYPQQTEGENVLKSFNVFYAYSVCIVSCHFVSV